MIRLVMCVAVAAACSIEGQRYGFWKEAVDYGARLLCKHVTVTTIFGSSDTALPAMNLTSRSPLECNVAITDYSFPRNPLPSNWTIVRTHPVFSFGPRDSRIVKILLHLFFPHADSTLYFDANRNLKRSAEELVDEHFANSSTVLVLARHETRVSFDQELAAVSMMRFDNDRVLSFQRSQYALENRNLTFLSSGAFVLRRKSRVTAAFSCLWYAHFMAHSQRDQLALVRVIDDLQLASNPLVTFVRNPDVVLTRGRPHSARYNVAKTSSAAECEIRMKLLCNTSRRWLLLDSPGDHQLSVSLHLTRTGVWHGVPRPPALMSAARLSSVRGSAFYLMQFPGQWPRFLHDNVRAGDVTVFVGDHQNVQALIADPSIILIDVVLANLSSATADNLTALGLLHSREWPPSVSVIENLMLSAQTRANYRTSLLRR